MESFVPFGGFFYAPSDVKCPTSSSCQGIPRCHLCNEKYEKEVISISRGGFTASVTDQYQSTLPSWLQMVELGKNNELDVKTKDDGLVLSTKVAGLQKKWDEECQRLHHIRPHPEANNYQTGSQFSTIVGLQFAEVMKQNPDNQGSDNPNASSDETKCKSIKSCMPILERTSTSRTGISSPLVSRAKDESSLSSVWGKPSITEDLESGGFRSPRCSLSNSSVGDGTYGSQKSPASATSVTTELSLGFSAPTNDELKKSTTSEYRMVQQECFSPCLSTDVDLVNRSSNHLTQSLSCSHPDLCGQFDRRDVKKLFRALTERVGWQYEAISVITQTISCFQKRNEKRYGANPKGDIWFNFSGPDRLGKRKIAVALAEILYGSSDNFICVDLSSSIGMMHANSNFDHKEMSDYGAEFRGKTHVDYIAGELFRKPLSIVFLENVDKADALAQNSLSQAIRIGKFSDSHGREVSINNSIFVTTSTFGKDNRQSTRKDSSNYSEDRILRAKGWPVKILVEHTLGNNNVSHNMNASVTATKDTSTPFLMNKRKLMGSHGTPGQLESLETAKRAHNASTRYLDLNLPAEENEAQDTDDGNSDTDSVSHNSEVWLQDFFDLVDQTVVFEQFDFDALADVLFKKIKEIFQKFVGSECLLEIESAVMEQFLAAAYLSDRNDNVVEDWVEQILGRGFMEVQKRYSLTSHSIAKLVACEGLFPEEQAPGVCLPSRVILN